MAITKNDLLNLRWSVVLFVALTAIAAITIAFATRLHTEARQAYDQSARLRAEARRNAAQANQVEQELRDKIAKYQTMAAHGIIGQEHRIDWIETIREIKQARKLIDVKYEIGPQEPVKPELVPSELTGYDIMASPMKLDMQLLHEDDLLGFLGDLRQRVQGYLRVQHCSIGRVAQAAAERGPVPQLQASCDLSFITIRERR